MPYTAHQHVRRGKKRKLTEIIVQHRNASPHHDSVDELHKNGLACHGNSAIAMEQPHVSPTHGTDILSPKYFVNSSLREHMASMVSELKEAKEKLIHWMREELQAFSGTRLVKPNTHLNADKGGLLVDGSSHNSMVNLDRVLNTDATNVPTLQNFEDTKGGNRRWAPRKLKRSQSQDAHKGTLIMSSEAKSKPLLEEESKVEPGIIPIHENGLDQNLQSHADIKSGAELRKEGSLNCNGQSKTPADSKSALFDVCFGVGLGDDVKDVEGLGGSLESAVTIREDFDFKKSSLDVQKSFDHMDRLHETKSTLFDMGFGNEESTEGNGVDCSLESGASSKDKSGFDKASSSIHGGFSRGFVTGFGGRNGDERKAGVGLNSASSAPHGQGSSKWTREARSTSTKGTHHHSLINKGLITKVKSAKSDEENRQGESIAYYNPLQAGYPGQSSLSRDTQQQQTSIGMKGTDGCVTMFKGSTLEKSKNEILACQEISSFADVFNSAGSSIFVMKNNAGPPPEAKAGLASMRGESGCSVLPTPAVPAWHISTSMKNTSSTTLHDSKAIHLEYASRSKLGDAVLSSERSADFSALDPILHYASQFPKSGTEVIGLYPPQERPNANTTYFSSLCTNTSSFLSSSDNRAVGMQYARLSINPTSNSAFQSMLMGVPSTYPQVTRQDTLNLHTFLGLNVNGLPMVTSGMHTFPGLYLQGNQELNQASFKHVPSSISPMPSRQESSAVNEKTILELNF